MLVQVPVQTLRGDVVTVVSATFIASEILQSEGLLIGLVPSQYLSRSTPVRCGDRLFLYTDGVLEATDKQGAFFGDERFHTTIVQNAAKSCAELGGSILEEMTRWSGGPVGFDDDVTLIVVEVQ